MKKNKENNLSKNIVLIVLIIAITIIAVVFIMKDSFKNNKEEETNTTNISSANATKNETNTPASNTTNSTSNEIKDNKTSTPSTNSNSNTSTSQTTTQNTNTNSPSSSKLYIGTNNNFQTFDVTIDDSQSVEEQAKYLINQVCQKLSCSVSINEIYSGKGGMTIDLKSNSTLLTETNSSTVYSFFDSIKQTLQQYFGTTMDIYFSVEDKDIVINTISPTFTIESTVPYKGSAR